MPLTYSAIAVQVADESFIQRVEFALLQDVNNGTTRMMALPATATDVTLAGQSDRLARKIVLDPHAWATTFARLLGVQLIAKSNLLDPAVTTDGDLFSAIGAIWTRFLG
jgi:hypothetical protein